MSKSDRFAHYFEGDSTTVSLEGIFDGIKKIFDAKAPDPRIKEKNGKKIHSFNWVSEFKDDIRKTYANIEWVNRHINSHPVKAPKMSLQLSFRGKVFDNPVDALTAAEKIIIDWSKSYSPKLKAYAEALKKGEALGESEWNKDQDVDKTIKVMLKHVDSIKLPMKEGEFGPEWFGGEKLTLTKHSTGWSGNPNYKPNTDTLPALTAEQVVASAKLLLDAVDKMVNFESVFVGSGCDSGIWFKIDEDTDAFDDLTDKYYFQAKPTRMSDFLESYLSNWSDTIYTIGRWLHTQITKENISLESIGNVRLAQYFDKGASNPANSDPRVGLFGTSNGSNWRDTLIPLLKCAYFNPIVKDWNAEAQAQEQLVKRTASAILIVITPKQKGFYSFVELTDMAIRTPERLFFCVLDEDEGTQWDEAQAKSMEAIKEFIGTQCSVTVFDSLQAVANALNGEVAPVSADGEAGLTPVEPTNVI